MHVHPTPPAQVSQAFIPEQRSAQISVLITIVRVLAVILLTALLLWFPGKAEAGSAAVLGAEMVFHSVLTVVCSNDYAAFQDNVAIGSKDKPTMESVQQLHDQLAKRLKGGYATEYMGVAKHSDERSAYVWKVQYADHGPDSIIVVDLAGASVAKLQIF